MEEKIKQYLSDFEKEKGVEILLACETGSRAWGFPSPDSDFDIRIIYKYPKDWYLDLVEGKDTIEYFLDNNEIDISGWDLRKSLRLLWKSNPPLLERIQSPIIYKADPNFLLGINTIAQNHYSRIATIYHYLSMAKKGLEEIVSVDEYKLKKFFYTLRASFACLWILEKTEMPPIEFIKMVNELESFHSFKNEIEELIALKSTVTENYMHKDEGELIAFMQKCIERADNESRSLPSSIGKMSDLNAYFKKTLD